jgi:glycine C-acetyltransferase
MSLTKIEAVLSRELDTLEESGALKGKETVITKVIQSHDSSGPRYLLEGYNNKEFIRMNSNSYLGMAMRTELITAEEQAIKKFGVGPGAVRFISGTYEPHVELERNLAEFHHKEAGMIFSNAYVTVMSVLYAMTTKDTIIISDALNHNCIINGLRLSQPKDKNIYNHNDMAALKSAVERSMGNCRRVLIITDGVFSMRGDHSPLSEIADIAEQYNNEFEEGIVTIVDDSHGIGAIGETGRGTMEVTKEKRIDILIATLGKALGVNGGYLVSTAKVIAFLRERAPFYIYSNPITVAEAKAAIKALEVLDSNTGRQLLKYLQEMISYFRKSLIDIGYETITGKHPVVPLMIRDTKKTVNLVNYLKSKGILSTGIYYPIVPKGDEEIRFQICADHTKDDIDYVLNILKEYKEASS